MTCCGCEEIYKENSECRWGGKPVRRQIENKERADFDIVLDSFVGDLDLKSISSMPVITIYKNTTKDYPGKFVARLYDIRPGEVYSTRYIMLADDILTIQKEIPFGMTRFAPHPTDDPVVMETWI